MAAMGDGEAPPRRPGRGTLELGDGVAAEDSSAGLSGRQNGRGVVILECVAREEAARIGCAGMVDGDGAVMGRVAGDGIGALRCFS